MSKGIVLTVDQDAPVDAPMAKAVDSRMRGVWDERGAVTCRSCRYPNPISQSFYALSVQNLYCRKCGRMIDRDGKLVVPA